MTLLGSDAINILYEAVKPVIAESEKVLQDLLREPRHSFDDLLSGKLPEQPGLYIIRRSEDGVCLHAGGTKSRASLRARVWNDHYTGNGEGDLVVKVMKQGNMKNREEAQAWIKQNCSVQWLVRQNGDLVWLEHYMLGVVRPIWGS